MKTTTPKSTQTFDILIIGAGLSGIYSLYSIRKRFPSWKVRLIEAGSDVGGVWYWNKYPGCRIDTESLSYCFSFDKELLDEWDWTEAFASQPETYKYIRRVAEKHDMYKDIELNTRIESAWWNNDNHTWTFYDANGKGFASRFFVSCLGFLSAPTLPNIPGVHDFEGQSFHTSRWPEEIDISRDFSGKHVGIIGTGATGVQAITALSKEPNIASLHVFQRTANWVAPLHNSAISIEDMQKAKTSYDALFKHCLQTPSYLMHQADPRKTMDLSQDERLQFFEKLYNEPGFGKWLGVFSDTYTNREANRVYSDFIAAKIRQRVNDPVIAESLVPNNHGFGTRRVPLESGYFEAFNKSNVHLVDLKKTPISCIEGSGIRTSDGKLHELDVLIFATGFDAITGTFNAIDWHAKDGRSLIANKGTKQYKDALWPDHRPWTFLGLATPAMPNMFMVLGPHQAYGNATRNIEHTVNVICDLLDFCNEKGYTYVEATPKAADAWTEHVLELGKSGLANEVDSWMTGVNRNVKGKTERTVARYLGTSLEYRKRCELCKSQGYKDFVFQ